MIIDRKYSTKHEHLVEYLDNSLTYGAHPLPVAEKADTCHYGVKTSVRMYWEGGSYCIITSTGYDVSLLAQLPDSVMAERIIDRYDPYSIENNYWKRREV